MTDLYPAAAAVDFAVYGPSPDATRRQIAAAALKAAADQVVPAEDEDAYIVPWNLTEHMRQRQDTRRKLHAIAAELEAQP